MHFARVLRQAGMPVGTDRVQLSLQALQIAGLESRRDFQATLAACMIDRAEQRPLFEQAFLRDPFQVLLFDRSSVYKTGLSSAQPGGVAGGLGIPSAFLYQ